MTSGGAPRTYGARCDAVRAAVKSTLRLRASRLLPTEGLPRYCLADIRPIPRWWLLPGIHLSSR